VHVLYIHQHFTTPSGSIGTRSYEFARRLLEAGHTVTMVCGASGRSETTLDAPFERGRRRGWVDGIDVVEFDIGYSTHDSIAARVRKFVRFGASATRIALTARYDLVFATSTPLTAALPGILARWLRLKPFVLEIRDLWPELPKALGVTNPLLLIGMSVFEWLSYHSADRVVGLAPGIVRGIVRRGIAHERTALIPNGCDLAMFEGAQPRHASELVPGGISPTDFVCVYAGAHGIANGLHALLPVAAELKRIGADHIKLLLIGSGATKPNLQAEAERRGLRNIIFTGNVPKLELMAFLKGADAGLQLLKNVPAFYEGTSPNKFFDYLAAGIPVVVNYPGWVAQMVEERNCGTAVPPDNAQALAAALMSAAAERGKWRRKGVQSLALATEKFSRDALGRDFVTLLEDAA
jgi:glycosyltransferase involved in cell wall biosynthesis